MYRVGRNTGCALWRSGRRGTWLEAFHIGFGDASTWTRPLNLAQVKPFFLGDFAGQRASLDATGKLSACANDGWRRSGHFVPIAAVIAICWNRGCFLDLWLGRRNVFRIAAGGNNYHINWGVAPTLRRHLSARHA